MAADFAFQDIFKNFLASGHCHKQYPQTVQLHQTQTRMFVALIQACKQAAISISYLIRRTFYDHNQQHERAHFPPSINEDPIGDFETDEENYLG